MKEKSFINESFSIEREFFSSFVQQLTPNSRQISELFLMFHIKFSFLFT